MKRQYNLKIEHLPVSLLKFKDLPQDVLNKQKKFLKLNNNRRAKKLFKPMVDFRSKSNMPPVYDQQDIGSCTAQALCAAYSFLSPEVNGSRLFLYYNERLRDFQNGDNNVTIDDGSSLTNGIKCLQIYGVCPEVDWPYDTTKYAVIPPTICYTNALNYKAIEVYNVKRNIIDMKNSLSLGIPFVIGILIYSSFESDKAIKKGIVHMPNPNEQLLGGHAVLVCGYNDSKKQWIVRNSWGTSWGDKGYFYLPYRYLLNSNLSSDFWAIKTVS